jgi:hypothetical protein
MKLFPICLSLILSFTLIGYTSIAQDTWPKTITAEDGTTIKLYQWQPESFSNNELKARAAISVLETGKTDPVFGVAWLHANTRTSGNQVQVESIEITSIKLPGDIEDDRLESFSGLLENSAAQWQISMPLADLQSSIDLNKQQTELSTQINNTPPKILYSATPSILVLIDGAPKVQYNKEWEIEAVVNTPFTIVKNQDGKFYLYGGKHWYNAPAATGPYAITTSVSQKLQKIEQVVNDAAKNDGAEKESEENTIYKIIVSTEPAELIQSKGEANFSPVEGSGLLYVSNSENDIFMDTNAQDYYVLISGRWYKSKTLSGKWQYTAPNNLPADFAKIPEGSPKDNVLASVAGTDEAQDALQEAEIPQTAKVDRRTATAEVIYDGDPEFEAIDGTDLAYATNTSASVVRWRGRYYSVDNGVWFESRAAMGPWAVSVSRPYAVALIPPRYPVYHMKYVYIYDITPDYVWMGYTPGYLNTFIYGPTVVYGTGYYYRPWYRDYYFARPYTWGFGVRYNPWFGWGLGFGYSNGWFNGGFYSGVSSYGYGGGWWGPRSYRPSYCWSPYRYSGGYYGRNAVIYSRRNYNTVRTYNSNNNIYRNRGGIASRDYNRSYSERRRDNGGNWSYNNNNRVRSNNNNFPGNRVDQRGSRPSRVYTPGRNNNNPNNGGNRTRPQNIDRGPRNDNNNDNNRINPNQSRRSERFTPGTNDNRSTNPRSNNNGYPQRRSNENGVRPERQSNIRPQSDNSELRNRNNASEAPRSMPGRVVQPQRRELLNNRGSEGRAERSYQPQTQQRQAMPQQRQAMPQRQAERRESVRPSSEQRSGGDGGGSRPSRGGDGNRGGRRGN